MHNNLQYTSSTLITISFPCKGRFALSTVDFLFDTVMLVVGITQGLQKGILQISGPQILTLIECYPKKYTVFFSLTYLIFIFFSNNRHPKCQSSEQGYKIALSSQQAKRHSSTEETECRRVLAVCDSITMKQYDGISDFYLPNQDLGHCKGMSETFLSLGMGSISRANGGTKISVKYVFFHS